jgi:hypothetical protein
MTEAEWLAGTDPEELIEWYATQMRVDVIGDRRVRLLVCGLVRRVCDGLTDEQWLRAVEVGERFADGLASEQELLVSSAPFGTMTSPTKVGLAAICSVWNACCPPDELYCALGCACGDAIRALVCVDQKDEIAEGIRTVERRGQAQLVRDVVGTPFRPSPPLPPAVLAWNDGTVRRIAQAIYEERQLPAGTLDATRLAILADALLDAGCGDDELIRHCRSEGPHVRGYLISASASC